jgi:hypothetical protein
MRSGGCKISIHASGARTIAEFPAEMHLLASLRLLLALACAIPVLTLDAKAQLSAGVRSGLSVSTVVGGADLQREGLIGFSAGMFARHRAAGPVSIQAELLVTQRGARIATDGRLEPFRSTYLEVPLLFVVTVPFISVVAVDGFAGPAAGILLAQSGIAGDISAGADVGIMVGVDVSSGIRQRRERFGLGVRQTVGVLDGLTRHGDGLRHSTFTVTAHLRF